MKNKLYLLFGFVLAIFYSSCKDNAPKEQAGKFLTAFYNKNYDEAKLYATERTGTLLHMFKTMDASVNSSGIQTFDENALLASLQEPIIQNDTCRIRYQHPLVKESTEELVLLKIKNKWLVEMALDIIDPETMNLIKTMNIPVDSSATTPNANEEEEAVADSNMVIDVK